MDVVGKAVFQLIIQYTPSDFVRLFEDAVLHLDAKNAQMWASFPNELYFRTAFFKRICHKLELVELASKYIGWPPADFRRNVLDDSYDYQETMAILLRRNYISPRTVLYAQFIQTLQNHLIYSYDFYTTTSAQKQVHPLFKQMQFYHKKGFGPCDLDDQGRSVVAGAFHQSNSVKVLRYLMRKGYKLNREDFKNENATKIFKDSVKSNRVELLKWMNENNLIPDLTTSQKTSLKRLGAPDALAVIGLEPFQKKTKTR